MNTRKWIHVALVTLCFLPALVTAAESDSKNDDTDKGFVSIFNGKDMTGWEGKPGWWIVEDEALTGISTVEKPCKKHNYLMYRGGQVKDFELRLLYRISGGNSGIQFRSKELPDWNIAGYQADLEAGKHWTGALYDVNNGRAGIALRGEKSVIDPDGTKHVTKVADSAELYKKIKPDDWNEYHIIAIGNKITLKINGVIMSQAIDTQKGKAWSEGIIGFQLHPGPPMKVQFKDIRLKKLGSQP